MNLDNAEIITFNDADGNLYPIRDISPINEYRTGITIPIQKETFIDEVISQQQFYGDGAEDLSFQVVEHNIEKLVECGFEVGKLKSLKIPIIEDF